MSFPIVIEEKILYVSLFVENDEICKKKEVSILLFYLQITRQFFLSLLYFYHINGN